LKCGPKMPLMSGKNLKVQHKKIYCKYIKRWTHYQGIGGHDVVPKHISTSLFLLFNYFLLEI
jgi:hypothetical protein